MTLTGGRSGGADSLRPPPAGLSAVATAPDEVR